LIDTRILAAMAALLALTTAATADGQTSRAYYCCESPTWSGVYAGFHAGGAWADTGWTFPFVETYNTAQGQHFTTNPQGAIVGGHLGYNHQFGAFLIGAEISYAGSNMTETLAGPVTAGLPADTFRTHMSDLFTTVGRFGVALDKVMLYGKAGYANSNVDLKANSGSPVPGISAHTSSREDGWVIGGAIEYRAMRSLVFGIDYNYVTLGGGRFTTTTGGTAPGLPFSVDLDDVHIHTVTARLSILLDRSPTAPTK
jgi:outer membrane immunogenic protein